MRYSDKSFATGEVFEEYIDWRAKHPSDDLMTELLQGDVVGTTTFTCGTANQGNSYLLDKLLTTEFPLGVVLM